MAHIRGAAFDFSTENGFSKDVLYSTRSYQTKDLGAIRFENNDLSGWGFAGQNMSKADFNYAKLIGTDFSSEISKVGTSRTPI